MRQLGEVLRRTHLPASLSAAGVAGVALWLSRAAFDVAGPATAPERVAMLPGFAELTGLVTLCALLVAGVLRLFPRSGSRILTPLLALGLLAVPYLPWLPDWLPSIRLLAGPGRSLLWAVVLGQVFWLAVLDWRAGATTRPPAASPMTAGIAVFAVSLGAGVAANTVSTVGELSWPALIGSAGLALLVWGGSFALTGSFGSAAFGWAASCLAVPFIFNAGNIAPGAFVALVKGLPQLLAVEPRTLFESFVAVLFDQEYGILPYAPVLLLGVAGLGGMMRGRDSRAPASLLAAAAILVVVVAASLDPWWSERMMPGRTAVLVLPLLGVPAAWMYERVRTHPVLGSAAEFLLLASLAISVAAIVEPERVRLPQQADGSSSLLEWMSPAWHLWNAAPTFLESPFATASYRTGIWLAAAMATWWVLSRIPRLRPDVAALATTATAVCASTLAAAAAAALPAGAAAGFNQESRAWLPLLEEFDPARRPWSIRYDPFSIVPSGALPPMFSLGAGPDEREGRQPIRVLLNARFRLPAGEYEATVETSPGAQIRPDAEIGLQVGRSGSPLEAWPLISTRAVSQYRFSIPIDAEFVGFRASRGLEKYIARLTVRPLSVVEAPRRFHAESIRTAAMFGSTKVFFHDDAVDPESDGFWVRGRTTANVTVFAAGKQEDGLHIAIHSGSRPNTATIASRRWKETIELTPGTTKTVVIPFDEGELLKSLSITTRDGFVPAELEPASKDRRLLGLWVTFPQEGA